MYLADQGDNAVRRVRPQDGVIEHVAGNVGAPLGDGGPAADARIDNPRGLAVGPDGSVYIVEDGVTGPNARIRRVYPDGTIQTVAGAGPDGPANDPEEGALATAVGLRSPEHVAVGPDGTLYLAETGHAFVRSVAPDGRIVRVAGSATGAPGCLTGNNGPARSGLLRNPSAVAVGPDGSLYIADSECHLVRRVRPDGLITVAAGIPNPPPGVIASGDGGPATAAVVRAPHAVVAAADGALSILQEGGLLRRVDPGGIITTVAGGGSAAVCGNGPPTGVDLANPKGVAVGADGAVYVTSLAGLRVCLVGPPLPGLRDGEARIASEDAHEVYTFDQQGRHLQTQNALTGRPLETFTYTGGLLTALTDRDGATTTISRAGGALAAIVAPGGQATEVVPDAHGYLAAIANPAGDTAVCTSTEDGLLLSYTTPAGHTSTFAYDADGRLAAHTAPSAVNPSGETTTLVRPAADATGHTVAVTSPEGRVATYRVERPSTGGMQLTNTFPSGLTSTTSIAANGDRTTTLPDGMTATYMVAPDPRFGMQAPVFSRTTTSPEGRTLTRSVARAASPSSSDPAALATATETVVVNGRPPSTRAYGRGTNTLVTTSAEGRVRTRTYDTLGRLGSDAPAGTPSSPLDPVGYTYQAQTGLLETVSQGTGDDTRTSTLHYDAERRLDQATDPLGRETPLTYSDDDLIATFTLPPDRIVAFTYDANGNLQTVIPPHAGASPVHAFDFTPVDLTARYTPPVVSGTGPTLYDYNADRQLELVTRPDGQTIDPAYDPTTGRLQTVTWRDGADVVGVYTRSYHASGPGAGRLRAIMSTVPLTSDLAFSYDGSLLTQTAWTGLVPGTVTVGRTYDDDFRLAQSSVNGASPISFLYDEDGLVTLAGEAVLVRSGPQGRVATLTVGNVEETRTYNTFGEIASITAVLKSPGEPDQPLLQLTYPLRDTLGRILAQTETVGTDPPTTIEYAYDLAGRLQDVTRNGVPVAPSPAYTYDPNGNRLTAPGLVGPAVYDDQDRLVTYGAASYASTPNGELLRKTVGPAITDYQYDVFGNLRAVTLPDGTLIEYVIDTLHRRVGKHVDGVLVRAWLYDNQLRPIAELDGTGAIVSRFVYASRANIPDYMVRAGTTYRILADHLGSVRLVVDASTGITAQEISHDEFGVATLLQGTWDVQPFGYAGGLYDPGTGLVRFGMRDYDSVLGRWTAKDPVPFSGIALNLYEYALGDPINWVDPDGADPLTDTLGAALALARGYRGGSREARSQPPERAEAIRRYHHCLTSCEAAKFGVAGRLLARAAGEAKEWIDARRGLSPTNCELDRRANEQGLDPNGDGDCAIRCASLAP